MMEERMEKRYVKMEIENKMEKKCRKMEKKNIKMEKSYFDCLYVIQWFS